MCGLFDLIRILMELKFHSTIFLKQIVYSAHSIDTYWKSQLMFSLHFHYEDVLRQDLLLKLNYANVMEVPGLCKIRVVPKAAPSALIIKNTMYGCKPASLQQVD